MKQIDFSPFWYSTKSDASDSEFKTNGTAGQHDIISNGNCRENCVAESYESVSDEKNAVSVPANSFHERRFSTSSFSSDISSLSKLPRYVKFHTTTKDIACGSHLCY